ncbi:MAG: MATE family efflux transporter [Furfurilactobacillus sp.]|jgi:putative MATE family efflux protein|uniref:Multidrug export protein MepA n=1 Tax=Furfurilactobacillus milii TaxID=2888272 RepID=A0ABT6D820_9LACO|nr:MULTISPECIES: MATE family efflux transporter [Furfurilactobacillus]QLE65847.1 Multi antimicrobial extrusion protein Na -drug antiporter MATE of MDR efflux pumps [Furfurilactobacillus rossiae]MCF6160244.1 MATE family efflux transporter [Furfurilactobacillus milii]MCF6162187.1 MATE family efflux transporter [Furfurilactobacillus milii]MCF6420508.1 MATE family efflux transporter [Furfurilactobacillus milii]MCH4012368.1 MATE family efflux transporter [Furfurilactobacillus sp.]
MDTLFTKTSVPRAYFTLAMPVVISMIASMIYNLVDTFFISQTQNPNIVAGVTVCTPLFSIMLAIGDVFGLGGSALVSKMLGSKQHESASQVSRICFYAAIVVGILTAGILLIFEAPILTAFGASSGIRPFASAFYRIMAIGGPLIIVSLVPSNLIRTEGLARESMIGSVAGLVVTILLDPLLIFGFHLYAAGAALATVIGYLVTDLILGAYVIKRCRVISLSWHIKRSTFAFAGAILVIGIPASMTNLMQAFGTALLNNFLVRYGAAQVAAFGIATKIYMIVMLVMVGFAFGAQPLVGYNYGAHNQKRFRQIVNFDLLVEVVFSVIFAAILMLLAPVIVRLFMTQKTIVTAGVLLLRALLSTTPFIGAILVFTTVFQSTGKALGAFLLAISRQGVIFAIVIYVAHMLWGYLGVVWAQPLADVLTCLLGLVIYRQDFRRMK